MIGSLTRRRSLAAIVVLAVAVAGCGSSGPDHPTAKLAGRVTIDAAPIETGRMQFIPRGKNQAPPTFAEITDGRYAAADVSLGEITITFTAPKLAGEQIINDVTLPVYDNLVPRKYRDGLDVQVDGDNDARNFALKSN